MQENALKSLVRRREKGIVTIEKGIVQNQKIIKSVINQITKSKKRVLGLNTKTMKGKVNPKMKRMMNLKRQRDYKSYRRIVGKRHFEIGKK